VTPGVVCKDACADILRLRISRWNVQTAVTLLLVDDHELVRETLAHRIDKEPDLKVVASVSDADAAVRAVVEHRPRVILLDIDMPGRNPFDAAARMRESSPDARVAFLSGSLREHYLASAFDVKAAGYILKSEPVDRLIRAVRIIARGGTYFSPAVEKRLARGAPSEAACRTIRSSTLTPREKEVLMYIARGMARKEIANAMHISIKTVERHSDSLMNKLDIHDRVELTRFALREGLVEL